VQRNHVVLQPRLTIALPRRNDARISAEIRLRVKQSYEIQVVGEVDWNRLSLRPTSNCHRSGAAAKFRLTKRRNTRNAQCGCLRHSDTNQSAAAVKPAVRKAGLRRGPALVGAISGGARVRGGERSHSRTCVGCGTALPPTPLIFIPSTSTALGSRQ